MESVAHFLQLKAYSCERGSDDFDQFGRSSFNRYYYAVYLQVRSMLGELNEAWATMQHANIPPLLRGPILNEIKRHQSRAERLRDREAVAVCHNAKSSVNDLATLMTEAYAVRVTADYNPNIAVVADDQQRFLLNEVSINTAHAWPVRAREHGVRIRRAWKLIDG